MMWPVVVMILICVAGSFVWVMAEAFGFQGKDVP